MTQGFRGYSRELLLSEEMSIFRRVFKTYELLAYIYYRAQRPGFKCLELLTARVYPDGAVPAKITKLGGVMSLMSILILACMHHYDPD